MFGKSPILFSDYRKERVLLMRFIGDSHRISSSIRVALFTAILVVPCLCSRDHLSFLEVFAATIASWDMVLLFLVPELYGVWTRGFLRARVIVALPKVRLISKSPRGAVILSLSGWS